MRNLILLLLAVSVVLPPSAEAAAVRSCPSFTIASTLTASDVKRSSLISCRKARNLLKAAYRAGPLKIIKTEQTVGRPTFWVKGG